MFGIDKVLSSLLTLSALTIDSFWCRGHSGNNLFYTGVLLYVNRNHFIGISISRHQVYSMLWSFAGNSTRTWTSPGLYNRKVASNSLILELTFDQNVTSQKRSIVRELERKTYLQNTDFKMITQYLDVNLKKQLYYK